MKKVPRVRFKGVIENPQVYTSEEVEDILTIQVLIWCIIIIWYCLVIDYFWDFDFEFALNMSVIGFTIYIIKYNIKKIIKNK